MRVAFEYVVLRPVGWGLFGWPILASRRVARRDRRREMGIHRHWRQCWGSIPHINEGQGKSYSPKANGGGDYCADPVAPGARSSIRGPW